MRITSDFSDHHSEDGIKTVTETLAKRDDAPKHRQPADHQAQRNAEKSA